MSLLFQFKTRFGQIFKLFWEFASPGLLYSPLYCSTLSPDWYHCRSERLFHHFLSTFLLLFLEFPDQTLRPIV